MEWNKLLRFLAVLISATAMLSTTLLTPVLADSNLDAAVMGETKISKIDSELQAVMKDASDDELIPVWIWLKSVETEKVNEMMIKEHSMNPEDYKDEIRFKNQVLPRIEAGIVAKMGYEAAHTPIAYLGTPIVSNKLSLLDSESVTTSCEITPIDEAVAKEYEEYLLNRRAITKKENTDISNTFIEKFDISEKNIIYSVGNTSTLVVRATKADILKYAAYSLVDEISYYEDYAVVSDMNIALDQIGVYSEGGTGNTLPGGWLGHNGLNIKIGIIETSNKRDNESEDNQYGGRYDSTAAMLAPNSRISFVENIRADGTSVPYVVDEHATWVSSIIAGMARTVNGEVYMGVVPWATVYQMPASSSNDVILAINKLIDLGVHVINISMSGVNDGLYDTYSREIDRLIAEYGVVIVASAGNTTKVDKDKETGEKITTPGYVNNYGLAYNTITVGNAQTKSSWSSVAAEPFSIFETSSYQEASYLSEKPDVSAPGTYLNYVQSLSGENVEPVDSGTSFSAAVVTGIVAQVMQANSSLRGNPTAVKAVLLLGADSSQISTIDNPENLDTFLREKSGIGMVNAINAVNHAYSAKKLNFTADFDGKKIVGSYYLEKGDIVRAIMVYSKENDLSVTSSNYRDNIDDIDFYLYKSDTGYILDGSNDAYCNVEYFECTIPASGYYDLGVRTFQIADLEKPPVVSIVFDVE